MFNAGGDRVNPEVYGSWSSTLLSDVTVPLIGTNRPPSSRQVT